MSALAGFASDFTLEIQQVTFKQLADTLRPKHPEVDGKELFINHTLWNRDDDRIFFFVRGDFDKLIRCSIP